MSAILICLMSGKHQLLCRLYIVIRSMSISVIVSLEFADKARFMHNDGTGNYEDVRILI